MSSVPPILEQKMLFLGTMANVSMFWWVSTTVLCVTVFGAIWKHREDVRLNIPTIVLALMVAFFVGTVIYYAEIVDSYLENTKKEVAALAKEVGGDEHEGAFKQEFEAFQKALNNGQTTFWIVLGTWCVLVVLIFRENNRRTTQASADLAKDRPKTESTT